MKKSLVVIILSVLIVFSCTSKKADPSPFTDANFYLAAKDTSNRFYYQNGNILSPLGGSPHGAFKLFFNYKAASVLDANMELPVGGVFPDSSFIVKEAYSGGNIFLYAIMFKNSGSWTWAEYYANGDVFYGIGNSGGACIGCHTAPSNRDYTLTFDLH